MTSTAIVGNNYKQFGKDVLITNVTFAQLEKIYEIEASQSKLDPQKVLIFRDTILYRIFNGKETFFSPLIISARRCLEKSENHWVPKRTCKIHILDGRYRVLGTIAAKQSLEEKQHAARLAGKDRLMRKYQTLIEKVNTLTITLQIYLTLTRQEEKFLFNEIHNNQKRKIQNWVITQYEQREDYSILARKLAKGLESTLEIEQKQARVTNQSSALTSLGTIRKGLLAMWEGNLVDKDLKRDKPLQYKNVLEKRGIEFWETLLAIFPKQAANRTNYVSGFSIIQISLAYTVFLLTKRKLISHKEAIESLTTLQSTCAWKHEDLIFAHLYDPSIGKIKSQLSKKAIETTAEQFYKMIDRRD